VKFTLGIFICFYFLESKGWILFLLKHKSKIAWKTKELKKYEPFQSPSKKLKLQLPYIQESQVVSYIDSAADIGKNLSKEMKQLPN